MYLSSKTLRFRNDSEQCKCEKCPISTLAMPEKTKCIVKCNKCTILNEQLNECQYPTSFVFWLSEKLNNLAKKSLTKFYEITIYRTNCIGNDSKTLVNQQTLQNNIMD